MSEPTNRDPIAININREVEVILTEHGRKFLRQHYAAFGCRPSDSELREGPVKFQLWALMNIFGSHLYMGSSRMPFEANRVVLLPDRGAIEVERIKAMIEELEANPPAPAEDQTS